MKQNKSHSALFIVLDFCLYSHSTIIIVSSSFRENNVYLRSQKNSPMESEAVNSGSGEATLLSLGTYTNYMPMCVCHRLGTGTFISLLLN